jgi:hypothetical protein
MQKHTKVGKEEGRIDPIVCWSLLHCKVKQRRKKNFRPDFHSGAKAL